MKQDWRYMWPNTYLCVQDLEPACSWFSPLNKSITWILLLTTVHKEAQGGQGTCLTLTWHLGFKWTFDSRSGLFLKHHTIPVQCDEGHLSSCLVCYTPKLVTHVCLLLEETGTSTGLSTFKHPGTKQRLLEKWVTELAGRIPLRKKPGWSVVEVNSWRIPVLLCVLSHRKSGLHFLYLYPQHIFLTIVNDLQVLLH